MIALCPGSFDPVHHGHLEIIARAAQLFDEVIVGVAHNSSKKYRFSLEERVQLVRESLQELGIEGVSVEPIPPGVLLAEYAAERGAKVLVKGLRSATDYSYEAPMASMNRHLAQVETVFLAGEDRYGAVSSTIIREVASLGGDVTPFVPEAVARALKNAEINASSARANPDAHPSDTPDTHTAQQTAPPTGRLITSGMLRPAGYVPHGASLRGYLRGERHLKRFKRGLILINGANDP